MDKLRLTTTRHQVNGPVTYVGNWYGPRPLQILRTTLDANCVRYGPQLKLLKNGCNTCRGPVGSKTGNQISFSGGSGIRSATTNLSKTYYSDTVGYLRSRGQNFTSHLDLHKAPGIAYATAAGPIWPETVQQGPNGPVNSSLYASNTPQQRCPDNLTVYKPNNVTFSTQGAVSSSTHVLKRSVDAQNMPKLSAYEKKKKLKLPPQPYWGTLG
jgi:hypothetical protein